MPSRHLSTSTRSPWSPITSTTSRLAQSTTLSSSRSASTSSTTFVIGPTTSQLLTSSTTLSTVILAYLINTRIIYNIQPLNHQLYKTFAESFNIYNHIQLVIYINNLQFIFTDYIFYLDQSIAPQHLFRACDHRLSLRRTMRLSPRHHHHNGLMTTTPLSELKFQGIISSQTQRQAELTSRSSQCLMQWPSVVEHLVSSILGGKQLSSFGQHIRCIHLCGQAELTSSSTFILKGSESSEPCINISEVDDYIFEETSGDSHQEGRSSLNMVIRSQRRVEFHLRAEEHQSVIVLDYIFLTNPHHDIARRVSSNIKQQESSSGDPSHPRIISLGIIVEHISAFFVIQEVDILLWCSSSISIAVILLHQHQS